MSKVVLERVPTKGDLLSAVQSLFAPFGGLESLLGGRKRVLIKINAVDFRPETFISPAILEAVIIAFRQAGVKEIRVMENCTQGNFTRLVFAVSGLGDVCRRCGVRPLYLDEGPTENISLPGLNETVRIPRVISRELLGKERSAFFLNLPKLKTHSMSIVTLGIKNLLGFMDQRDRMKEHNYNLHARLAALGKLFRPDFTLIDGLNAVYYGHYPPTALLDKCIDPLNLIVGGDDLLAVDTVAAKILGYRINEVPHLRLAKELGIGCADPEAIEVIGDLSPYTKKYPFYLYPSFPPDVKVIKGSERCCPEGCQNNTLTTLQFLYHDHGGKGGFTILMGKGFDPDVLNEISGPILLSGKCAIEETRAFFNERRGGNRIYLSPYCNDLASTIKALTKLMKVNPLAMVPLSPLRSFGLLLAAKIRGSKARVAL